MKKDNFRIRFVFILVVAMAFMLTACKGKTEEITETNKGQETIEPTEVPEEEPKVDKVEEVVVEEVIEEGYSAHYGSLEVIDSDIYREDFESDETKFEGRGSAKVEIVSNVAGEGSKSLYVSERESTWNGAMLDVLDIMLPKTKYIITAKLYYDEGPDSIEIDCKFERNQNEYLGFASALAKKGEWVEITGDIYTPNIYTSAYVYFETSYSGTDLINFYIDDIHITSEAITAIRGDIPVLKDVYADYFSVGMAATRSEISDDRQELIKQQFNSFTAGNEMKPDSFLDYDKSISDSKFDDNPQIKLDNAKQLLDFAQEAGIPVRGHTLVWHAQTPRWFFTEGYSKADNATLVSKELMLKRMENYIKNVLETIQTEYPGVVYCWDVVNEAINPGESDKDGYRVNDSLWYEVIGPEFLEKAFEYARKYADPEVKLFYNDYNTEDKLRMNTIIKIATNLKAKGLIDGIGLQSHIGSESPSLVAIEESIRTYGELGLEIHITELDMGLSDNSEAALMKQAQRYKRLFTMIKNSCDKNTANITNVTFWGLSDDITWLSKPGKPSYPLLFDKYLIQKPAFWGVVLSPDIALY